jgi:hypothetical protein
MATFSDKLSAVLEERKMGNRTLAKLIDPDHVESARRSIRKWLSGQHQPNRASIDSVTDALGLERGALDPDDEEESLYRALVANLNRDKLRRALDEVAA